MGAWRHDQGAGGAIPGARASSLSAGAAGTPFSQMPANDPRVLFIIGIESAVSGYSVKPNRRLSRRRGNVCFRFGELDMTHRAPGTPRYLPLCFIQPKKSKAKKRRLAGVAGLC